MTRLQEPSMNSMDTMRLHHIRETALILLQACVLRKVIANLFRKRKNLPKRLQMSLQGFWQRENVCFALYMDARECQTKNLQSLQIRSMRLVTSGASKIAFHRF